MPRAILLIGDIERAEVQPLWHRLGHFGRRQSYSCLTTALQATATDGSWHPILLAPSYRDEFAYPQVEQLRAKFPLAEIILVVGSWSEGETRSGRAWPGVRRLYVDQLLARLDGDPIGAADGALSWQWMPATLTPDERWLQPASVWPIGRPGLVVIAAETQAARDYLMELCQSAGYLAVAQHPDDRIELTQVDAVIYDAVAPTARRDQQLRSLLSRFPGAALTVLVNFPRADERQDWLPLGVHGVLGKPFVIDDLLTLLAGRRVARDPPPTAVPARS